MRIYKMESKFEIEDLVWAKMKSFPAWPGKIIEPKPEVKKPAGKKPHHFVFFFGSENYAWIPEENVYLYSDNRDKFKLQKRIPKGFKEALEAIDDELNARPFIKSFKNQQLPSIDEELAQIFPNRPSTSPQKDYTREPLAGKKKRRSENLSSSAPDKSARERSLKKKAVEAALKITKQKETNASKSTGSMPRKKNRHSLPDLDDQPKVKKAKVIAKVQGSPSKLYSAPEPTKIKPKMRANLSADLNAMENLPLSPPSNSYLQASMSSPGSGHVSSGTQIEETMLTSVPPSKSTVIPTPMRIGFLGLGIMGQGMVMNLLRSGHEVTIWNRTAMKFLDSTSLTYMDMSPFPVKDDIFGPYLVLTAIEQGAHTYSDCREFVKSGAFKGNNPAEVLQSCDITFSCVADSTAVKDLVFGNYGVLQGISKGKCFVEMSTIDEETMQDVAEAITARGGVFLEAPVVGSRVPALEGQLIILAAGERKLYDECYSCFDAMGKKALYLGSDIGAATRMKLIINMVMGSVVASLAEGMAMAEKVGLDQEDVAEVLSLGALSCPTVIHKSQAILSQRYDPHFPLQHQQKDLRLALLLGDKVEQPLYVASAANELYKKARRLGYGDSDISAVYRAASN